VKERADGIDFYYKNKRDAIKLVEFFAAIVPTRYKTSERLISSDPKSNTANVKNSYSVEILPLCRDDLVCLPHKLAFSLGNISPLLICYKLSSIVYLIDPLTLQITELSSQAYWTVPFRSIASYKQLIQFTVLDITPLGPANGKFALADVTVVRSQDFGRNNASFISRTHLGNLLKVGDTALGYDLSTSIFNDSDIQSLNKHQMPDFMLVRKCYPERVKRNKKRHWRLKTLDKEELEQKPNELERATNDYNRFIEDLEEDPEMRSHINLYKVPNSEQIYRENVTATTGEMVDDDAPEVGLDELIDDMNELAMDE